ncbi:AAA family ATPase [Agrobacterium rosae]|uniref:AAA family ATPase n=1 Tax=Agrobacterium rosae TaxID=1972867 RepID=UPI000CD919AF|nr:AAA family ATPase [Agrobacterium rosae]POO56266.1 hypothetical protein CTT39_05895 [Agrobacterium rosae]
MYLKTICIRNLGPIAKFDLEFPEPTAGVHKPVIFVGKNGSGKTNLLSLVGDALIEAAAQFFQNATPGLNGPNRPWFRVVGSTTVSLGSQGAFAVLQFDDEGDRIVYHQKAGNFPLSAAIESAPGFTFDGISWPDTGNTKSISISNDKAETIFLKNQLVYFPSVRNELPDWLNTNSVTRVEFDLSQRFSSSLHKPIYVESGFVRIKQWLLALFIDTRVDIIGSTNAISENVKANLQNQLLVSHANRPPLVLVNEILKIILDNPDAEIGWAGRNHPGKLNVISPNGILVPSLDALSTGQATLLNMFGTLVFYHDQNPHIQQQGICVIDEIDAHMHIDLQHRALPRLMKLFPRIQFIISSHSPVFLLGISKLFPDSGALVIDVPSGLPVDVELFSEFEKAFDVFRETIAFGEAVVEELRSEGPLLVLLEGETDPLYFNAALDILDEHDLKGNVEFRWIGSTDPKSGQGFHTGKTALDHTRNLIMSKPDVLKRRILLLYDNDSNKMSEDHEGLWIRAIPTNGANSKIRNGIENLLPENCITDDMYDETTKDKGNGTITTVRSVDKMKLCEAVCLTPNKENFVGFSEVFKIIRGII